MTTTKRDIAQMLTLSARGLTEYKANAIVDSVFDIIKERLEQGEDVQIRGFGTFAVKTRAPRSVRNINTGVQYKIGCTRRVTFKTNITPIK